MARLSQRGSIVAMALVSTIFFIETVLIALDGLATGGLPFVGVAFRIVFLIGMGEGLLAMNAQRQPTQRALEQRMWKQPLGTASGLLVLLSLVAPVIARLAANNQTSFDVALAKEFDVLSESLPMKVDENTTLTQVELDGDDIFYEYTMPNFSINGYSKLYSLSRAPATAG